MAAREPGEAEKRGSMAPPLLPLLLLAMIAAAAAPVPGTATSDGCIHVRDFGAMGDGVTGDTSALQQAIFAAFNASSSLRIPGWHSDHLGPDLCLDASHYLITDTLNFTHSFDHPSGCAPSVRGLGSRGASLRMNTTARDIFSVPNAFHWAVTGVTFVGGRTQLKLGNNNTDESMILVSHCSFHSSSGPAILTEQPTPGRRGGSSGQQFPGGAHWPAEQSLRNRGMFSTQVTVRDCKFIGCNQVLVNWGDWTSVEDCWITSSPTMTNDTAVFENFDRLFLRRILGVPGAAYSPGQDRYR